MEIQNTQQLYKGKFTTLWGTCFTAGNKTRTWEWLEKFDVAYVLPITSEGKYVLTKQFRIPLNAYVLETPAGIIDSAHKPAEVALKEMQEETGYTTEHPLEEIPPYPISAALTNGIAYGFCARNVKKTKEQVLEDAEDIEVMELSKEDLLNLARNDQNQYYVDPRLLGLIALIEE
jgi:ADP-ribose pyrophosphatase